MKHYVYDLETNPNFFSAVFIPIDAPTEWMTQYIRADLVKDKAGKANALKHLNAKIFVIWEQRNDIREFKKFVSSSKESIFAGYNSMEYDDLIIDFIMQSRMFAMSTNEITHAINTISRNIINSESYNVRRELKIRRGKHFIPIDLYKLNYLDNTRTSLKQVEIALKWYRVEELKLPEPEMWEIMQFYDGNSIKAKALSVWDRYIVHDDHADAVVDYNINDVLATLALYVYSLDELGQRDYAINNYGAGSYSDSRSRLADKLMARAYMNITGFTYWSFAKQRTYRGEVRFADIIVPTVKFRDPILQEFLHDIKSHVVYIDVDGTTPKWEKTVKFRETEYTFAKGGLHSRDKPKAFEATPTMLIKDVDADSYYPTGIINMRILPDHISPSFLVVLKEYVDERLAAKFGGDKATADILKIVINAVFGKMGSIKHWLYDPQAMYKVTINLQLFLLMLAEDIEDLGCHVISANTDGIVAKIPVELEEDYITVCNEWAKRLNFGVSYTDYSKYVRTTVNDYLAVQTNGKVKLKGDFVIDKTVNMGYYAPIIARSLKAYFVYDTPVDEYIRSATKPEDIYDFCISVKVGGQFQSVARYVKDGTIVEDNLQKNNRYYVSPNGITFLKKYKNNSGYRNIIKGKQVVVMNDINIVDDFKEHDIDYGWYKSKIYEIIQRIRGEFHKTKKVKNTGSMFDNL